MIDKFEGRWYFLNKNFKCSIEYQGIEYPTVYQFMVAMKLEGNQFINGVYFTPVDLREMISRTDIKTASLLENKIKVRKNWEEKRYDFMRIGIEEKFKSQNILDMLLLTEDKVIIDNDFDDDNFVGKLIMDIRKKIK
jgi:predicted NAD-dependent protein-ADP-ribosyltransferase YbiA (DUF1768 family)